METINATEAARRLGITTVTLRKWLKKGKISGEIVVIDDARQWAIPVGEVERLQTGQAKGIDTLLEQRIDALERRVTALEQVNTSPRKSSVTPRSDTQPSMSLEQPPGTLLLADFAARIGVDRRKLLDIVMRNKFPHTAVATNRKNEMKRYFSREQRETVLNYLDERGIEHK